MACTGVSWILDVWWLFSEISKMTKLRMWLLFYHWILAKVFKLAWYTISVNHRDIVSHCQKSAESILGWRHFRAVLPHPHVCQAGGMNWVSQKDFVLGYGIFSGQLDTSKQKNTDLNAFKRAFSRAPLTKCYLFACTFM